MTAQVRNTAALRAANSAAPAELRAPRLVLEANATFAVAWREVLRAIKSRQMIAINIIFPVLFMGIMGGMIQQNLGKGLPYAYLPFMLVGMVAQTMYQGGMIGVTTKPAPAVAALPSATRSSSPANSPAWVGRPAIAMRFGERTPPSE